MSNRPILTTRDCANRLGVSPAFVVGEILERRLAALVIERPGRRRLYRVTPTALEAYRRRYGWTPARS